MLSRADNFRVENRGSRSGNLCPKFFYLDYLCFNLVFYYALQYPRRLEGYSRREREIVPVKASWRAALNDTNGVRTGAHDAEWEAGLSLSLSPFLVQSE